jgi:NAD(P)-dependent dehydrogenase (short-subunit alcohol dehydrogenase family)
MNNAKQGGSFINISSITGLDQSLFPGAVAYGTSKVGLNYLAKVMCSLHEFHHELQSLLSSVMC